MIILDNHLTKTREMRVPVHAVRGRGEGGGSACVGRESEYRVYMYTVCKW